jgi:hypothetical protein
MTQKICQTECSLFENSVQCEINSNILRVRGAEQQTNFTTVRSMEDTQLCVNPYLANVENRVSS